MSALNLICDLAARNVRLSIRGKELKVDAPGGTLTDRLKQTITEYKVELIEALRLRSQFNDDEFGRMAGCPDRAWQVIAKAKTIFDAEVIEVTDEVVAAEFLNGTKQVS